MTAAQAKRLALLAIVAAGLLTTAERLVSKQPPSIRTLVGVWVGGLLLAFLADAAPSVAGPLAGLLLAAALLGPGVQVFQTVTGRTTTD